MNKQIFAIFLITILLYDCIFVNLKYEAEYRFIYSLFPFQFYQAVFSQSTKSNDPCVWMDRCETEREYYSEQRCYCDGSCKEYDDCCFYATFSDTSRHLKSLHLNEKRLTCETKAFLNKYYGVLVVSECPAHYLFADVSEKCKLAENIHPVSSDDGTTYRNVYCAYCHNVSQYNSWRLEYHYAGNCHGNKKKLLNVTIPNKIKHIMENNCFYRFVQPSTAEVRSCLKNVIMDGSHLCSEYQSPIAIDKQLYRNVHCYNGSIINKKFNCIPPFNITSDDEKRGYGQLSLTGLFNIRPLFDIFGQKTCEENFHYDNTKDACVPSRCLEENCNAELIRNYKWVMSLEFFTNNIIDIDFHMRLTSFLYLSLPKERYQIRIEDVRGKYKCRKNEKNCCVSNTYISFSNGIEMSLEATEIFKSKVNKMTWDYIERRNRTVVSAFNELETTNIDNECNVTGIGFTFFTALSGILKSTEDRLVINKTWQPPIEVPKHVEGVLIISDGNGQLPEFRLEKWNLQYGAKNYKSQTSPIPIASLRSNFTSDWSVGTILSYSTLGMSCCFLILTLLAYSYFGLFQSTSGVISKYMMATMLAAKLWFIVGVGASNVVIACTAIGIISHYLWLTSFMWISIFLFSVLKMMRTLYKCPGALTKGQKLSKLVYCFGFVLPLFIVLPCTLLDIFTDVDIGYSDGDICFPTGLIANMVSFTLPVLIMLCFNIVTLVITSVSISRYNNTVILLQSVRQVRSFMPIYLRLSILCACPWILGIISDILQFDVLRYIYISLAGLHGTFVGVSFLCAKSVRDRLRSSRSKKPTNGIQLEDRMKVPAQRKILEI